MVLVSCTHNTGRILAAALSGVIALGDLEVVLIRYYFFFP